MSFNFEKLKTAKHILLETYRKNNQSVRTPVWFVQNNSQIYVITRDKTGKVKRLRNNPNIKVAMCTFTGKPTSGWISGIVKFANEEETKTVLRLRKQRYGFMDSIARFVSKSKGNIIVFSIVLDQKSENEN